MPRRAAFLVIVSILLASCSGQNSLEEQVEPAATTLQTAPADTGQEAVAPEAARLAALVETQIEQMSLPEKVGQLFVVQLRFTQEGKPYTELDDAGREYLAAIGASAVLLFTENFETVAQVVKLVWDLQQSRPAGAPPLLIAVDQEGGLVDRLNRNAKMGATPIPSAARAAKHGVQAVWASGYVTGQELAALGISLNFAPITDIGAADGGGFLGSRAFSDNPQRVAGFVDTFIRGMSHSSVRTVLKHFPGHGAGSEDSHFDRVVRGATLQELLERDLVPIRRGIAADAAGVMVAHVAFPQIDPSGLPASVSRIIVSDVLREGLGFEGLIITDALEMQGILAYMEPEEAAVAAILAGVDLILSPAGAAAKKQALLEAVNKGLLDEERINDSLRRILAARHGSAPIFSGQDLEAATSSALEIVGSTKHRDLIQTSLY